MINTNSLGLWQFFYLLSFDHLPPYIFDGHCPKSNSSCINLIVTVLILSLFSNCYWLPWKSKIDTWFGWHALGCCFYVVGYKSLYSTSEMSFKCLQRCIKHVSYCLVISDIGEWEPIMPCSFNFLFLISGESLPRRFCGRKIYLQKKSMPHISKCYLCASWWWIYNLGVL